MAQAGVTLYIEEHPPAVSLAAWGNAGGPKGHAVAWLGLEELLLPEERCPRSFTAPVPWPPAVAGFTNPNSRDVP